MEKLSIGEVIYNLRKKKGITQEEMAKFIGISRAAVSKWESGISYPDIVLLPVIATFFNVTCDTLLNFKIELSKNEVTKIFSECETLFSKGDLHEGIEKSKDYVKKYPSSYELKLNIGCLYSMYSWKALNEEKRMNMIGCAIELLEDISLNCSKEEIVEQALFQLGALYPSIGEEEKGVKALKKIHKSELDPDMLLANIYIGKNELKKARGMLQSKLFKDLNDMTYVCLGLAKSYIKEEKGLNTIEKYFNLILDIKKVFLCKGDCIFGLAFEYLTFSQIYLEFNENKKAIDMLHKMVQDIRKNDINKPRKFNSVWCFNEIPQGKKRITMNLYENLFEIFKGKNFDLIRKSEEFNKIIRELKVLEEKSLSKN